MGFQIVKGESLEINGLITLLYGSPSAGKTSTALTASKPILFDFDGGAHRSGFRIGKDIVRIHKWEEISSAFSSLESDLANYDTLIIDTVETCLDFIRISIENADYKMKANKLQMYGRMKDEFYGFLSRITKMGKNVILIAHATTEEQNGVQRTTPKITGGSKDIVFQKSDFIGYMRIINNKRTVDFNPTDYYEGKNSANLPLLNIPDFKTEANWFQSIIEKMTLALKATQAEQDKALIAINEWKDKIDNCTLDEANLYIEEMKKLSGAMKSQVWAILKNYAEGAGWIFDKDATEFVLPVQAETANEEEFTFE